MARVPGIEWVQQKIGEAVDAVTPASIGAATSAHQHDGMAMVYPGSTGPAMPVESGSYTGHVDEQTVPGVYRIASSAMTEANGYPPTPDNTGTLVVQTSHSSAYLIQTVYSNKNEAVWTRSLVGGTWYPWVKFATELDTGWRFFDYLSNASATVEGSRCLIRRVGNQVFYSWQATWTGSGVVVWNTAIIPAGFRPTSNGNRLDAVEVTSNGGRSAGAGFGVNSSGSVRLDADGPGTGGASLTYFTADAWPTTLPGTPA